jgi:hypothetical protein
MHQRLAMRSTLALLACAGSLAFAPWAAAAPVYSFTFSDGTNIANGLLATSDLGGGQFLATSGSLTVTSGAAFGSYSLVPGGPAAQSMGPYIYDDVLRPALDPILTNPGLLFSGPNFLINIYSVAAGAYKLDYFTGGVNTIDALNGTFQLAQVPEPNGLMLVALALLALNAVSAARMRSTGSPRQPAAATGSRLPNPRT